MNKASVTMARTFSVMAPETGFNRAGKGTEMIEGLEHFSFRKGLGSAVLSLKKRQARGDMIQICKIMYTYRRLIGS